MTLPMTAASRPETCSGKLIVRVAHPPHTRVTRSIDGANGTTSSWSGTPRSGIAYSNSAVTQRHLESVGFLIAQDRIRSGQRITSPCRCTSRICACATRAKTLVRWPNVVARSCRDIPLQELVYRREHHERSFMTLSLFVTFEIFDASHRGRVRASTLRQH